MQRKGDSVPGEISSKNKYRAKAYDQINIVVPKGKKADIQAFAAEHGESLNGFINRLIDKAMKPKTLKATSRPKEPSSTNCPICGNELVGNRSKVYCSDNCRTKAYKARKRQQP